MLTLNNITYEVEGKRSSGILAWNWGTNLWLSLALMGAESPPLLK